jgi:uncharacterized membrane protein YkoI
MECFRSGEKGRCQTPVPIRFRENHQGDPAAKTIEVKDEKRLPMTGRFAMRHHRGAGGILAGILAMLLFATGGMAVVAHARDAKSALTADQAIACIRTAVAARTGLVKKVEVEEEDGKQLCEIKIIAETGQKYELHVDLDTNTVVKTEED